MESFKEQFKAATTPGPSQITCGAVIVAYEKNGNVHTVLESGSTSLDLSTAKPISANNTFWIASCSKLVTTVATLQCLEKGLLDLDSDVSTILPEWSAPEIVTGFNEGTGEPIMVKAKENTTLRRMLTHSNGMGHEFLNPELKKWLQWHKDDSTVLNGDWPNAFQTPLLFEPGHGWNYGVGIDWAGKAVERVTNMRLDDYTRKNICEPLSMKLTTFQPSQHSAVYDALCSMTLKSPTGELIPSDPIWKRYLKDDIGGCGLVSTPNEYIKILISLLKNDGTLLRPETVDMMFQPQLEDDSYLNEVLKSPIGCLITNGVTECKKWNYGLGGLLAMEDGPGVAHKGAMNWGGHPNLFWWIDPTGGHCGLYASQLVPPGDEQSRTLALGFRKALWDKKAASSVAA